MDEEHLYSLLNKMVLVKSRRREQSGQLVCVDPVTLTIVLYDSLNQCLSMIFHHAIISISEIEQSSDSGNVDFKKLCDDFFEVCSSAKSQLSPAETLERRSRVLDLLKENNVPVEEQDDLLLAAYSVCISPPYSESDCKSSNALILSRIQDIIRS